MNQKALVYVLLLCFVLSCKLGADQESQADATGEELNLQPDERFMMQGKVVAQMTGSTLMGALSQSIQQEGIAASLTYCNVNAIPLTDSLAMLYQAEIKRTSLKLRNPLNKPTAGETKVLSEWETTLAEGKSIAPVTLAEENGKVHFYAPIFVQPFCLNCHGTAKVEMKEETARQLQLLYPEDKATGYASGDLRGMWSITFNAETE
jgi:hypothetical protein